MIELQSPRTVSCEDEEGASRLVTVDSIVTLDDAFRSVDPDLTPSWLRIGFGWEGDALLRVAAAYMHGDYFMPGKWQPCGSPLGFGSMANESDSLKRCDDQGLDPDIDCAIENYLWGLPQEIRHESGNVTPEASGLVFALALDEAQSTKTLAEVKEVFIRIDADHHTPGSGFTPVMSMVCDVSGINAPTTIVAGLFISAGLKYGIPGYGTPGSTKGARYYDINKGGPRAMRLQLRQMAAYRKKQSDTELLDSTSESEGDGNFLALPAVMERLGLTP